MPQTEFARTIPTGLPNTKHNRMILHKVFEQISGGIWDKTRTAKSRVAPFWIFAQLDDNTTDIHVSKYYRDAFYPGRNPYPDMTDKQIKKYFAEKIKQTVKYELNLEYENEVKAKIYKEAGIALITSDDIPIDVTESYRKADLAYRSYLLKHPFGFRGLFNKTNKFRLRLLSESDDKPEITVSMAYEAYKILKEEKLDPENTRKRPIIIKETNP